MIGCGVRHWPEAATTSDRDSSHRARTRSNYQCDRMTGPLGMACHGFVTLHAHAILHLKSVSDTTARWPIFKSHYSHRVCFGPSELLPLYRLYAFRSSGLPICCYYAHLPAPQGFIQRSVTASSYRICNDSGLITTGEIWRG